MIIAEIDMEEKLLNTIERNGGEISLFRLADWGFGAVEFSPNDSLLHPTTEGLLMVAVLAQLIAEGLIQVECGQQFGDVTIRTIDSDE